MRSMVYAGAVGFLAGTAYGWWGVPLTIGIVLLANATSLLEGES